MTDFQGRRYCYSNQPQACQWNCIQLANALFSADLVEKEAAEEALGRFAEVRVRALNLEPNYSEQQTAGVFSGFCALREGCT
jgi:uncharacterized protein YdiU (UPF0061 family)